ncbi:MAG: methyltransferase [Pirellulaceae bacterium]|nr:methyltransferase [Pirellulaceae bacterium]
MMMRWTIWSLAVLIVVGIGCRRYRKDLDYDYDVVQTWEVDALQYGSIVQFESVFWEPDDSASLRELIIEKEICSGRSVLEIGTGTGLISILCAQNDADSVVATEINPAAVANARYNAAMLADGLSIEVRQVSEKTPGAYSVIRDKERFDLILSNPPWEDGKIAKPADYAFYDPDFALMDSLLDGLPKHLNPGGRCLLAYGHVPAIQRLQAAAKERGYQIEVLDERELSELPQDFLPGMLVEIRLPLAGSRQADATKSQPSTAANTEPSTPNDVPLESESDVVGQ